MGAGRFRLVLFAVLTSVWAQAAGAAERGAPPSVAEIEAFVGAKLPASARDLRVADEAGIDRLMRLRFDASEADAERFAAALVPDGVQPGFDPDMALFGSGLDWWIQTLPPDAAGGETVSATNRTYKLVSVPNGPGARRVWLAVFTQ